MLGEVIVELKGGEGTYVSTLPPAQSVDELAMPPAVAAAVAAWTARQ